MMQGSAAVKNSSSSRMGESFEETVANSSDSAPFH
jgi:hypothetical protein